MGKIIDFRSIRGASRKPKKGSLDYESLWHYLDLIEIQLGIMEELFKDTEEMLRDFHLDPGAFSLMEDSGKHLLTADLQEFYDGGEESLDLCYEAVIDGVHYRTYADASICGEMVEFECMLMKWDGMEWLVRSGNEWERGPGADFFGEEQ